MKHEILCLRSIYKYFDDANPTLRQIDLIVNAKDIIVIMGRNGAGKTSLLRLMGGVIRPDRGTMLVDGSPVCLQSNMQAKALGIYYIGSTLQLIDHGTVADNLFIDMLRTPRRFFYSSVHQIQFTDGIIQQIGLKFCAATPVNELTAFQRLQVALLRAVVNRTRLLLVDEPFAYLNESEIHEFKKLLQQLNQNGMAIVITAHVISNVYDLGGLLCMLSDGTITDMRASFSDTHVFNQWAISLLSEKPIPQPVSSLKAKSFSDVPLFEFRNFQVKNVCRTLSFSVSAGESIGFFYADSSPDCTVLLDAIFGMVPSQGEFFKQGRRILLGTPWRASMQKIGYAGDPNILNNLSIQENITLASLPRLFHSPFLKKHIEKHLISNWKDIIPNQFTDSAEFLSRGTKKQLELIRWLCFHQDLLLLHEPIGSLDPINQKIFINKMKAAAESGTAFIIQSANTGLLSYICDRVFVFKKGKKVDELSGGRLSSSNLLEYSVKGDFI